MSVPTQPVTISLAAFGGDAVAGIEVTARMSDFDYTVDGVFVRNETITGTTDVNGECVLDCFPNAVAPAGLGTRGTVTTFIMRPTGGRTIRVQAAVPDAPCELTDILVDEVTGLSPAQQAVSQAQAAAVAADASADAAAASATAADASEADAEAAAATVTSLAIHVGEDPPADPVVGKEWFNNLNGKRYVYYDDGDSQQWVEQAGFYYVDDPVSVEAARQHSENAGLERAAAEAAAAAALTLAASASFATYTALRAYNGASKSAYITGYLGTAAPSGIAGLFTVDDSDTTSADNGGTIIVAANGKRWKRVYDGDVNVEWFGADGLAATDSSDAFDAALAYVRTFANTGGTLYCPREYVVSRALRLDGGITVRGASQRASVITRTDTTTETIEGQAIASIFYVTGGWNNIKDLALNGVNGSVDGIIFGMSIPAKGEYRNLAINFCRYAIRELAGIFLSQFSNIQAVSCNYGFTFNSATEKTSLDFTSCYAANCGYPYDMKLVRYSNWNALAADNCNWNTKPGNPYGTGFGDFATDKGIYHFDQCDGAISTIGAEGSYGNGIISCQNSALSIGSLYATGCLSEFLPNYAAWPQYAVGPIQTTTAGCSITIGAHGIVDFTNTVVEAGYPDKPVATLVAFNYDEAALGVQDVLMVTVNTSNLPELNLFAGMGPIDRCCLVASQSRTAAVGLQDYTALRAYAGASKNVRVTGYAYGPVSGIAGEFVADLSDTTSSDNGGTIIVASNGVRWKRVTERLSVNPLWFGAVPNDATKTAVNQAAFEAAHDASPGVIEIPEGLFWMASLWTITNRRVYGAGCGVDTSNAKTRLHFPAGSDGIKTTGGGRCHLEGFAVSSASSSATTGVGIWINSFGVTGDDMLIMAFGSHGVLIDGTGSNANCYSLRKWRSIANYDKGFYIPNTGDSNAGTLDTCDATLNGGHNFHFAAPNTLVLHPHAANAGSGYDFFFEAGCGSVVVDLPYAEAGSPGTMHFDVGAAGNEVRCTDYGQPAFSGDVGQNLIMITSVTPSGGKAGLRLFGQVAALDVPWAGNNGALRGDGLFTYDGSVLRAPFFNGREGVGTSGAYASAQTAHIGWDYNTAGVGYASARCWGPNSTTYAEVKMRLAKGGGADELTAWTADALSTTVGRLRSDVLGTKNDFTFATLPAAATAGNGARAYITDASVAFTGANIGSAAAGGGANHTPVVVVNGSWVIG